jgi:hypothetical protein
VFRRGWCLRSDEFKKKMLDLMEGKHASRDERLATLSNPFEMA